MGSRDLKECTPELFDKYQLFNVRMGEAGSRRGSFTPTEWNEFCGVDKLKGD